MLLSFSLLYFFAALVVVLVAFVEDARERMDEGAKRELFLTVP